MTPSPATGPSRWPLWCSPRAIVGCILAALRGPRWWRAAAFGAATAVTAAFSAALTKSITTYITEGWGHVFTHAQPYMLAVTGLGTVFLIQNALHAGPITASRTTMVTINPLVSIVLGVTLFADRLRTGPLWVTLEVAALAVLVAGVVVLARSPLVAGIHEAGDLGRDAGRGPPPPECRSRCRWGRRGRRGRWRRRSGGGERDGTRRHRRIPTGRGLPALNPDLNPAPSGRGRSASAGHGGRAPHPHRGRHR